MNPPAPMRLSAFFNRLIRTTRLEAARVSWRSVSCQLLSLLLTYALLLQLVPRVVTAAPSQPSRPSREKQVAKSLRSDIANAGAEGSRYETVPSASAGGDVSPATITDAVVSRHKPTFNSGRIEGTLRVLLGESFTIGGNTQITSDLYLPGTPTIQLSGSAQDGGTVSDGGSASPASYTISLTGGVNLPGRIHTQVDALQLPTDFPTSVPAPSGTRIVTVHSQSEVGGIGDWLTVRDLNVTGAHITINVPPGNYGTFTINGNSQLNFTAGTYNFSNTFNLDGSATLQATGLVTINVGQNLTVNSGAIALGSYTSPGDLHLNVMGSLLNVNGSSQVSGLVRAYNGTVTLNGTSQVRGQVIANGITLAGGKVIGAVWPAQSACGLAVFGPRRFDRTTGPPNQYVEQFALPSGVSSPYTLHIQNGELSGSNRVSSATVKLNGADVLTPSDLNQNVAGLDRTVTLAANNQLDVRVASSPGSYLIINICGTVPVSDTTPPTISITSPANNSTTTVTQTAVTGTATDLGPGASGVARVYVNNVEAAYNSADGTWTISNVSLALGSNQIVARAVDQAGNQATAIITVTRQSPTNHAPTADAGLDQTLTLPQTASLHGLATDDGLPSGSTLTTTWNKVAGPGTVTFTNANALNTTASFSSAGTYVLRLTATDGALSTTDDVTITVQPQNQPPTVSAGPDQIIALPHTATLNGTVTDDGLPAPASLSTAWSEVSGPGTVTFEDATLTDTNATFSVAGTYVLRLTANDGELSARSDVTITVQPENHAPTVSAGQNQTVSLPNAAVQLSGSASDDGLPFGSSLTVSWSMVSGPGSVVFDNPNSTATVAHFAVAGTYVLRLTASDGELSSNADVNITVTPPNQAPTVNAGADQAVTLPNVANLNGTVGDDGLPLGSSVSTVWSTVSGPGTVTFANPNVTVTTASFSVAGSYVLRLTANDSQLSTSDDIAITVNPQNQPPTVNAGPDQTITLPNTAQLNGTATDDGLPTGSTLSLSWGKVSGPGTVTFGSPNAAVTNATFSVAGSYTLRLTANDSQLSASDDVVVTVNPENHAPTVNAGPDQTITLPSSANLNGSVSDDGLPSGSSVASTWTKVSGPGTVTFTNPNVTVTTTSFSVAGSYVLRLTANDSQLSTSDDITITVNPQNQPPTVNAGADQTIALPGTAQLNGTATDDGLPTGSSVSISWSKVSGPGTVSFGSPNAAVTNATFSVAGSYTLRLTANDSQLSASDDVIVTVNQENHPPTVNAGTDQTITLPSIANLNGSVSDDGLPTGSSVTSTWTKVSGPGTVTFGNPNVTVTTAAFSVSGSYVLRLTASDSELTAAADITVIVIDSLAPPVANFVVPESTGTAGAFVIAPVGSNVEALLDNDIATSWNTPGIDNQFATLQFFDPQMVFIDRVRLQARNGVANDATLKDFDVQVSSTNSSDASFATVFSGTLLNNGQLQEFVFPGGPARARFIKLLLKNRNGSPGSIQLGTFNPVAVGSVDNIISLPGQTNAALSQSPGLIANGAAIYESTYAGGSSSANGLLGYYNGGWIAPGLTNQFATIQLAGGKVYTLDGIKLATDFNSGYTYQTAVKDFEVWVSTTTPDAASFTRVLSASSAFVGRVQTFMFPGGPVQARYVKYVPLNNFGGGPTINTLVFDVIAEGGSRVVGLSGEYADGPNPAEAAFDGVTNSYWYGPNAVLTNVWVKTALADSAIHRIYGVRINPLDGFATGLRGPKDFDIRVSTTTTDDSAFTTVYSGTLIENYNTGPQQFLFNNFIDARYVEFYWKNSYSTSAIGVSELEVLAAPDRGSAVIGFSSGAGGVEAVLDLDPTNQPWVTPNNQNTNVWFKLLLPRAELSTISHIALRPAIAYNGNYRAPKDFQLQVSTTDTADSSFTTVFAGTLVDSSQMQDFYFAPVQARYVRLLLLKGPNDTGSFALHNFLIYSSDTTGTTTRFMDRSSDSDGQVVSWAWNFGDGTTSTVRNPAHTFAQTGDYTVSLTVTDNSGLSSSYSSLYHVVESLSPDFALSPMIAHEGGESVRFTDLVDLFSVSTALRQYDFGDGSDLYSQYGRTSVHIFQDSGVFHVTLKVGDALGVSHTVTKDITVLNLPPVVDIDPGKTVVWGEQWTSVPRISDQSSVDSASLQGLWDFGDGQTTPCVNCNNANATVTHAYSNPGTYTAVLTITDKDGASASGSAVYSVNKRPISLAFQEATPPELGQPVLLRVRLMDSFANQPLVGRTIQFQLNGATATGTTDASGYAEAQVTFAAGLGANTATATFAEDGFYLGGSTYRVLAGAANQQSCTGNSTGTDFWLMFPGNYLDAGGNQGTFLEISSEVNTTGTVTIPGQNFSQNFAVAAHTTTQVLVNEYQSNSDQIEARGIHLVSQQPVTVYGLNNVNSTVDAFLGLPTAVLGNNYVVLGYKNGGSIKGTQFGIVASANATTVTITPTVTVGQRAAGVPYNITLNQGQTYLLRDSVGATSDLSGTIVLSDKPIAVFGGHECANIPVPFPYCDYIVEQLPPTDSWGTHFATLPLATRTKGDTFRFLAATNDTHVFLNGSRIAILNRGQYFERIIEGPAEVTSDYPILLAQYSNSHQYDNGLGDPFMMLIPPLEHYLNAYTVTSLTGFNPNLINVVAPTSDIGFVILDGTAIPAPAFVPIGTTGVSGAQLTVSAGTHTLSGPHPFGVYVYGFNIDVSYGYPGSACLSSVLGPTVLTLAPKSQNATPGAQTCVTATVKDQGNTPVNNQNVTFTITGAHPQTPPDQRTNELGRAQLCYASATAGDDLITATSGNSSDTASISWRPTNQPPVVNAGPDQNIGSRTANLQGSATDDGLPAGGTLTISWSKVSGPGSVTFANAPSLNTSASFSAVGTYVLRLTANDSQLSSSNDVTITVSNQPPVADFGVASSGGPLQLTTVSYSSYNNDGYESYHPKQLLDSSANTYWQSASGQASNQFLVFRPADGQSVLVDRVRLQNAYGANDTNVREFEVQVSSATANASDFRSVLNGSLPNNPNPQEFVFPGGVVTARFIKLVIVGNYGSASYSNLSTFQPVSAGGLDSIISFLGAPNSALNQSPALAPNGGAIYNFSYSGGTTTADPMLGYGRGGWITTGTTNQFATIQLGGGKLYTLDGVKLATWYDSGYGRPTAVKDFEVWISATTPDANSFTKVLTATVDFNPRLQTFLFPGGPVQAKYVKYVPLNNWGGAANINTQILDVIAEGVAKVVAASGQLEYGTSPPEEAFDGNLNTFWYGPNGAGSDVWVKTSLEDETIHKVYGVRITPLNSYYYGFHGPKDFDIRVSTTTTDDSAFTTVYSGTLSGAVSNNAQEFLLPNSVDAKYVEFYWKNAYSDSLIAVSELEVLADSAHGSTVVGYSSSSDPSSQGPANALDIDTISPWVTANGQNTNQWLKLSLPNGDLWTIDHIALMPGFAYCGFSCIEFSVSPKDFELQVSTTDASDASFSTVLSGSLTNTATLQHFSFPAVQARYVRLLLKNNYGSGSISILGFYVYTPDHGSTDARFVDRSTDADGHIVSWAWNFGDGGTSTAQSPLHHYATAGSYAVTLTVTDDGGLTNSHQMTYTASASTLAPDFALSPVTAYEGEEYVRFTDTTQLLMQPYGRRVFDFGNGVSVTDLYQANYYPYQFPDSGTFNVTMTIGADNGLKSSVTKTITVLNLPPAVTVDTGKTVVWGEQWTNAPHMSDPSPIDSQTLHGLWDFGDGQNFSCNNCTNTSATATHAYTLPGLYNATLTVNDKDGGVGSATATYTVNKRPTALIFQSPPTLTNGAPLVIHATLTDTFANVALSGKPVQFILNGATFSALTGANGVAEVSVPLPAETRIDIITGTFAGDSLYLSCGGVGVPVTAGGAPPAGTLGNQGTNFWLMFPHDYFDGYGLALQRLYISSRVDTSGTVTIPGAGFNFTQNFTVQTNTIATVQLPFVQVYESDVIQDKGIHVTSQQPVTIYGLNQRVFTSDAFLGLPVNTLGTDHFVLTYSNMGFSPTSEVGMVATENATTVTITPSATSGSRAAGVPYNVTLNQGQTYLLQNTVPTTAGDLTGSRVSSNKPIAVFAGHAAATIPAEAGCCADHLVEQLPPTNVWGKRFATIPIATRTKGDFFRFIAAEDATAIYLNGNLAATLNRGQWVEKIIKEPTEIIATAPIMVAQYSTSVFYDPPTTGKADPFEMIIPPYSQFLNHYTISTPGTGFQINYANVVAPTASLGSITLDGTPISASSFAPIGVSGYSGAQIPITVGMHNLDGPASFGVFVYGFNQDEGYGYPGGMNMSASVQSVNVVVTPETSDRPINAQACVLATVTNQDQIPLGGKTITFTVTGANPSNSSATTDAAGQAQFCFTGTHLGSDLVTVAVGSASGTASVQWLTNVPNQAPVVNAGVDQTISLPAPVTLFGSVTDDGLPSNTLNISWSKVSGPGNIAFTTPSAAVTSATFNAAGVYVLRLTASDTNLSTSDDVQVTVNPTPTNQPPTANAGPDLSVAIKGNLIVNSGNEEPLVNGEIPGWIEEQGTTWTQGNSSIPGLPDAHRGQNFFYVGADGAQYAELRQDVDVSAFAASIATGTQQFEFQTWVRSLAEFPYPDTPRIIVEFRNAQNNGVLATMDSANGYAINNWYLTETLQAAPVGTGWMRVRLIATRTMGGLNDAYFDSVSLRPVGSAAVKLSGAVSDDGLPYGSSMSANWIAVSGPGAVTFTNPNAASSGASFTTPGTYVLRLTASDGQASTNDDVTITVYPINQPPTVSGGTNQTITLPETAPLNGIVNDDGLPHGSSLSTRWKKDQGPGIVTFANPDAASTTASFSTPGFYVLILTADDSEYSGSAVFYVNVNPSATNQPPTVNAGADQTIALPTNTVTLNGAAADDGLPSGSTLVVQWTQVSGPALASFTNPNSAVTTAQFSTAGTYVLRLNASDGQLTTSDDVTITVTGQNQPPTVNAGPDQATILSSGTQLNGSAGDDGLPTGSTLTTSWSKVSGPGTVTFMNANVTVTGAQFSATGTYVLRLTASDGALSSSDDVTIIVNDNVPPPTVQITAPADDSSITEPTIVSGSVSGGAWTLEYSLDSNDDQNSRVWTTFASGNGATSGTLGSLDPTMMMNGLFDIRLSATDSYGQTSRTKVSVIVERNLKVGNFTVSFTDLSIPVAGVPMEVTRTYDSRDKRIGDFGFGWTLGLHNIRVEKSSVIGLKWYETVSQEVFPNYCLEPVGSHAVTVTFPGGKVFKFQPNVAPHCQRNAPITSANISFTAMPGTVGKLEVIGSSDVQIDGSVPGPVNLIGFASGVDIFNSFVFKFTAEDGTAYIIDQRSGLQSLSDPNGNTLTIGAGGIVHSSGKSIVFNRDIVGRITSIVDPNGNSMTYGYDPNGDLVSYTDNENNTSTYTYDANHRLLTIHDPRGIQPIRNDYDPSGRLISHTDGFGKVITYLHDIPNRTETVTDRLGHPTVFEYDDRGNVLRKTDARGGVTSFTYDANDNVLTETNALGKTTTYTYDSNDHRTSITDPLNNVTQFTYNVLGKVLTTTDPLGHVTTNTYNTAGNLLTTEDALHNITSYTYSIFDGQQTAITDAAGNTTSYEYTGSFLSKQTDALGHETLYDSIPSGQVKTLTMHRTRSDNSVEDLVANYAYDLRNHLTKTTRPDGSIEKIEYNQIGKRSASVDALGHRITYDYDDMGRLIRRSYPDGTKEEFQYDAEGRQTKCIDRASHTTEYAYDELGRKTKTTYPDGTFTTSTYDAAGQVLSVSDERNNTTRYEYDAAGHRIKVTSALNEVTSFAYDQAGNEISRTDANGHTISYEYDQLNRRTKVKYPDTTFTTTTYDAIGRVIAKADQAGKTTQFEYDRLGQLVKVTDALGQVTSYTYDEAGQQISQTDARNQTTRYEADPMGRKTKRTLPLGVSEVFTYDPEGNPQSHTDFNGKTTTYVHDLMNRLVTKTPDPSLNQPPVLFTYNANGKRATMSDASGMTVYSYDARNRLSSKQTPAGTLNYTYDAAGNLQTTRSSHANGISVDYSFDSLNRLSSVKDNHIAGLNGGLTQYNYDSVGNLQSCQYPNGVATSYTYNALSRLTATAVGTPLAPLASYSYTLGAAGNRTAVTELSGRTVNYTYDDLYRLTSESITNDPHSVNGAVSYSYDPVGNRLNRNSTLPQVSSQVLTYDANNRLSSDSYDNNGNTTSADGNSYLYDFENHLTSENGGSVSYVYDGDGNRASKTAGGVTTNYLSDSNSPTGYPQVVEEIQGGSVIKSFGYGHSLISQQIVGGSLSFYQYDGHGSVRLLTNASGAITDTYDYDAFGNLINRTGSTPNDYLYNGEQFDANIGFYYLRARYLNPAAGRFLSMDSFEGDLADPISLHKYLYANADPVDKTDPSGKFGTFIDIAAAQDLNLSVIGIRVLQLILAVGIGIEIGRYLDRRWRMWTAGRLSPNFHTCMVAKDSQGGHNWTYDVGGLTAREYYDSKESPFTFFEGALEKSPALGDTALLIPVGRMMDWQLELWEIIMMGGTAGADEPFTTPYEYAFAFRNCTTWTIGAAATARIVSLIPS